MFYFSSTFATDSPTERCSSPTAYVNRTDVVSTEDDAYDAGSTVVYTCVDDGSKTATITCLNDGTWLQEATLCCNGK